MIEKVLNGYGILTSDNTERPDALKHLHFRLEFISSKVANKFAGIIQSLFKPIIFWSLFVSGFIYLLLFINIFSNPEGISGDVIGLTVGIYFSLLIHELGHIAACSRLGLKHGGIGFGMYFIFPVMYADVTCIWQANRAERMIANMGGIFTQIIYSIIFSTFFLIFQNPTFYLISKTVFLGALMQLYPFGKLDGYWVLSDLIKVPNLLPKSISNIKKIVKNIFYKSNELNGFWTFKNVTITLFGIVNYSVIWLYLIYNVLFNWQKIVDFPSYIFEIFRDIIMGSSSNQNITFKSLSTVVFYILLLNLCLSVAKKVRDKVKDSF